MSNQKKSLIYFAGALVLMAGFYPLFLFYQKLNSGELKPKTSSSETAEPEAKAVTPTKVELPPVSFAITVPYTVQAPYANWAVHEESCEEAALLMYHDFLAGQVADIDPATADRELRALKAWQVNNWGAERDLTLAKVGQLAQAYYGYHFQLISNLTEDQIKAEVAAGHPVLVPVMTQALQNPHYSPGNVYHILLIKGYDATGVITNDAGIKEGKDWHYSWDILWSAVDAQNPKMGQGRVGLTLTN